MCGRTHPKSATVCVYPAALELIVLCMFVLTVTTPAYAVRHADIADTRWTADTTGTATADEAVNDRGRSVSDTQTPSAVTMGWLLRLVTGAPLMVGGLRQFYFILN